MAEDDCVRLDTRLAGQLRRYHTWPTIGQQNVADHTWQILRIYLCICVQVDPHIIYHIMFHDIGEHFTGDVPYPVKRDNPALKQNLDSLEMMSYMSQMNYWGGYKPTLLTEADKALVKQIEVIEMAEFGMDQVSLGNNHGFIIADRCLRFVFQNSPNLRLAEYVVKRLSLFKKQCHLFYEYPVGNDWWRVTKWEGVYGCEPEADGRESLQE